MTTARDIVKRAFRAAQLTATGVDPSAEDAVDGLNALNGMLHTFDISAVPIGHNTLGLDDTLLLESSYEEPIVYNLAVRVAAENGRAAPPDIQLLARDGLKMLRSASFQYASNLKVDAGLKRNPNTYHGQSNRYGYDIDEG